MPFSGYSDGTSKDVPMVRKDPNVKAQAYLQQTLDQIGTTKKEYNGLAKKYNEKKAELDAEIEEKNREYLTKISEWEQQIGKTKKKYDDHIAECDVELVKRENELEDVIARYHKADSQFARDKAGVIEQLAELDKKKKDLVVQSWMAEAKEVEYKKKIKVLDTKVRETTRVQNQLDKALADSEVTLKDRVDDLAVREVAVKNMESQQMRGLAELLEREKKLQVAEQNVLAKEVDANALVLRDAKSRELATDLSQKEARLNSLDDDLVLLQRALKTRERKLNDKERLIKEAQDEVR